MRTILILNSISQAEPTRKLGSQEETDSVVMSTLPVDIVTGNHPSESQDVGKECGL